MRKRILTTVALMFLLAEAGTLPRISAQEAAKPPEPKPTDSFKVEFTVSELDGGKKINSRSYSMLLRAEALPKWTDVKRLRMGSTIPISVGADKIDYENVGMDIDCRLMPMENGKVGIGTTWNYSSLAGDQEHPTGHPVIRRVRSEVEAVVPLDKPTVISDLDDVASTHHYVFEVMVTKINL